MQNKRHGRPSRGWRNARIPRSEPRGGEVPWHLHQERKSLPEKMHGVIRLCLKTISSGKHQNYEFLCTHNDTFAKALYTNKAHAAQTQITCLENKNRVNNPHQKIPLLILIRSGPI